jgi:hypothetical protein
MQVRKMSVGSLKTTRRSSSKVQRAGLKDARRRFFIEQFEDRRMMAAVSWDGAVMGTVKPPFRREWT